MTDIPQSLIEAAASGTEGHRIKLTHDGWSCPCGASGPDIHQHGEAYRHLVALELAAALSTCTVREEWRAVSKNANGTTYVYPWAGVTDDWRAIGPHRGTERRLVIFTKPEGVQP